MKSMLALCIDRFFASITDKKHLMSCQNSPPPPLLPLNIRIIYFPKNIFIKIRGLFIGINYLTIQKYLLIQGSTRLSPYMYKFDR